MTRAVGRLVAETDVLGRTTRYEYYPDGKRQKMIDARGNVFVFEYDVRGHQSAMLFPDGSRVSYQYNEQGKKIAETDQLGHTTRFAWNDLGVLAQLTDALGHATSYSYNKIGNLLSQTDANGHTTTFEYNKLGRRTRKTYPLGMSQTTSYDVANRTVSVTDFNGETTSSQYDQQGRVVATTFPDGTSLSYSYTASGQIAAVTDSHGTTRYAYDSDGRLTSVTDVNGATISYSYDALGRKQRVTVPSGSTEYDYDEFGRLTSVTAPSGAETRYTYDEHGNKASMIYPNGTLTEYGYDHLNRLISVETRGISGDLLASYRYTLNAKGQRTHVEERVGTQLVRTIDYTYDAADRLIEEHIDDTVTGIRTIQYTYDAVGNRLTKNDNGVITTYTYDDNDRLLTEGGFTYGYDNNGNLLSKTGNGEQYDFSYNALNQLVHADIDTGGGSSTVDYVYDHDGIRVGKTINGTDVIKYVVDKNRPYAQVLEEQWTNSALSATTSYVYGENLLSRTTNGTPHYYHDDGMGSTRTLTDMTGTVTDTYSYDAYGILLDKTGSTNNPYRYRGEQFDTDLNAYYLRARYYQQSIGRFLTTDPVEGLPHNPFTLHRYVYANDAPINFLDPTGKTNLVEIVVNVGIISYLSAGAFVCAEEVLGWGVYTPFAKYLLPEAYIVGFTMTGMMPYELMNKLFDFLNMISDQTPHPLIDVTSIPWANMSVGFGGELLLSVGSGEAAFFITHSSGSAVGTSPTFSAGFDLYDGFVYNLWNAGDYSGPFESVSLSLDGGLSILARSGSLFWDTKRKFGGPWGGASTFLSKSSSLFPQVFSIGQASTMYDMRGEPYSLPRAAVVLGICKLISITKLIESIDQGGNVLPFAFVVAETSLWTHVGLAHRYWNIKEEGYNIAARRNYGEPRPDGYRSGPSSWKLPF